MNFSQIKNIIFDLGNVIINIDFDLTYQALAKISNKSLNEINQAFIDYEIWDIYEKGKLTNQEFIDLLRNKLEINHSDQDIINAWNALLLDIPQKRIDKLKELSKKYRLFILSNTSDIHIIDVNRILQESTGVRDLKDLVEKAYYSYEINLRKPSLEIYKYVVEDAKLKISETLFLDDNLDNIIGANEFGLHTIHVTDEDICDYLKDA
jgi:glucose-1-phosphatase